MLTDQGPVWDVGLPFILRRFVNKRPLLNLLLSQKFHSIKGVAGAAVVRLVDIV
jgi:hypothetical protein